MTRDTSYRCAGSFEPVHRVSSPAFVFALIWSVEIPCEGVIEPLFLDDDLDGSIATPGPPYSQSLAQTDLAFAYHYRPKNRALKMLADLRCDPESVYDWSVFRLD